MRRARTSKLPIVLLSLVPAFFMSLPPVSPPALAGEAPGPTGSTWIANERHKGQSEPGHPAPGRSLAGEAPGPTGSTWIANERHKGQSEPGHPAPGRSLAGEAPGPTGSTWIANERHKEQSEPGHPAPGRSLAGEALYVKSSGTPVYEKGSATARVVETLDAGVAARVLAESGSFYKIALPAGGEGWVFKFKLTATPPATAPAQGTGTAPLGEQEGFTARESGSGSSIRARDPNSKAPDGITEVPQTERGKK